MLVALLLAVAPAAQGEKDPVAPGVPTVLEDVSYAVADPVQQLDFYLPAGTGFTTVLYVYGSGWHGGNRRSCVPIAKKLQSLGFACALVGHRLSPPHRWPAMIEDVAAACATTRRLIQQNGGDAKRLFLVGHSSGAQLVLLLVSEPRWLAAHELTPAAGAGVVGLSPPVDLGRHDGKGYGDALLSGQGADVFERDEAVMRAASPIEHLSKALPPLLLIVGERDFPMLPGDVRAYAARAKELGIEVPWLEVAGCDHGGTAAGLLDDESPIQERVLAFLEGPRSIAREPESKEVGAK
jgi:acetyl esterase/lipase